jgi:hypothetical protein
MVACQAITAVSDRQALVVSVSGLSSSRTVCCTTATTCGGAFNLYSAQYVHTESVVFHNISYWQYGAHMYVLTP